MIRNSHCPYCGIPLILAENQPASRSVEHVIPNAILTRPRSRGDGDFYACRKCNGAKSNIDYVLAVAAKMQSADSALAAKTLTDAVLRNDNSAPRFIRMVRAAKEYLDAVLMDIPIDGKDLYDYFCFLGKGQHFRFAGEIFNPHKRVLQVEFINKFVLAPVERGYSNRFGTNPFSDLARNPYTESIGDGECLIWSKGYRHLFIFHRYTAVVASLPRRTKKSQIRAHKLRDKLLKDFPRIARATATVVASRPTTRGGGTGW